MFLEFYQLKEQPFGVTPNPRYLYLGESHREALASLYYGVNTGRGLLALIAPPGMGKTTLLFRFLHRLRSSARTVFLFQTQCDSKGLLRYILGDLGINTEGQDFVTMHDRLNAVLLEEARAGRRFVLVIDEAQNLSDSVLETARLLSDFETPTEKLMQIVFAGQPQLAEKLNRPDLVQLRQRISILGRLRTFNAAEVREYIDHRLQVAGYGGRGLFTPAAIENVAFSSEGVPRNINNICFHALSLGYTLGRLEIDVDLIQEVAADLGLSLPTNSKGAEVESFSAPARPQTEAGIIVRQVISVSMSPLETQVTHDESDSQVHLVHSVDGKKPLVLESMEEAQVRGADILAEVVDSASWFEETAPKLATDRIDSRQHFKLTIEDAPDDAVLARSANSPTTGHFDRVRSEGSVTSSSDRNECSAPSITYAQQHKSQIARPLLVTVIFILTALGALFLHQDLSGLTTRTLPSPVPTVATSSSSVNAIRIEAESLFAGAKGILASARFAWSGRGLP
jgi:type II secretory pathway predicted ATPase ExeA